MWQPRVSSLLLVQDFHEGLNVSSGSVGSFLACKPALLDCVASQILLTPCRRAEIPRFLVPSCCSGWCLVLVCCHKDHLLRLASTHVSAFHHLHSKIVCCAMCTSSKVYVTLFVSCDVTSNVLQNRKSAHGVDCLAKSLTFLSDAR